MRAPNQIIQKIILLYRDKRAEFRLILWDIFMFLITGKEAEIASTLTVQRGREIED